MTSADDRPVAMTKPGNDERYVLVPQHDDDQNFFGNIVSLDSDGVFGIGGYEGMTQLTKGQAQEVAWMLLAWARGE